MILFLQNDYLKHTSSGVLITDITDHLCGFLVTDILEKSTHTITKYIKLVFGHNNVNNFDHDLNETDWDGITSSSDIHLMCSNFLSHVKQLYDKDFTVKVVKYRHDKHSHHGCLRVFTTLLGEKALVQEVPQQPNLRELIQLLSVQKETDRSYKNV